MIEEWTSPGTGMINATTERETEVCTVCHDFYLFSTDFVLLPRLGSWFMACVFSVIAIALNVCQFKDCG